MNVIFLMKTEFLSHNFYFSIATKSLTGCQCTDIPLFVHWIISSQLPVPTFQILTDYKPGRGQ
ncbi:hypothetical protein H6G80_23025 [Nostoc sp. FACHB-87]|uniref:hypothetical protein n=1 Tax=Nostocales TaxID=1161 RepID=UPI0016888CE5|nr:MULTISPECIES: hypothetical protein [Nostocales]MBD2456936.1 hypothetical protein [Nostoc sp. FACHB-87]MBD2478788.1 hypothetical protein [Anabaena sp. FACHB-83]MBD2491307.1 hypothetical protein [Aulosira sp. FACHB-615]